MFNKHTQRILRGYSKETVELFKVGQNLFSYKLQKQTKNLDFHRLKGVILVETRKIEFVSTGTASRTFEALKPLDWCETESDAQSDS